MTWTEIRRVESNRNAYDRHVLPDGNRAAIWCRDRTVSGFTLGGGGFGPLDAPEVGNIQALRIRPLGGRWVCYAWVDVDDSQRAEFIMDLGPL